MKLENIVTKSQKELKKALILELNSMGYKTHTKKGFTYAEGTLPVMLVAHLDTVHRQPVETICYSQNGKIMMSPEGIGGDDRAGVYMILQIIKKYRCHVLFCEDEEKGGIGAEAFAQSGIMPEINYMIELDRRGSNDAVFYDCANPDFTNFVCSFGFKEDFGSFSDISIIAPALGIAAVNISAGYYNEHTRHEFINLAEMERNIELIGKMVNTETEAFDYIECRFLNYETIFGGHDYHSIEYKDLMYLPESAFVRINGEMTQDRAFFIDEQSKVYKYLDDIGFASMIEGAEAFTEHGTPLRYNKKYALELEVIQYEDACDMYGLDIEDYLDNKARTYPQIKGA